ncbi:MAG: molybdenum cofactor biosynthesis protein MoaE [Candidatus Thalassarchaeaceae archaeon]|nr:MAG: molybdenum cofactor biosynthesis protein MoaE [Euryarchaeota archaeon]|tara:strand:+ start:232 stop:657 length:426 start_codon:yes stop_codon:yes gene_type:complete
MGERVTVQVEHENLDPNLLLEKLMVSNSGAIVSFTGLTRGDEDGIKVYSLDFDAWEEQLPNVLRDLGKKSLIQFGVESVAIAHRVGNVGPEEPIVAIHVASRHRKEAFQACSWLIDSLKSQAPLWKKENREDGTHWKEGLG